MSLPGSSLRTIWLSDLHLGSRACRVEFLLDFLHTARCERLYLVGDVIDLIAMRRSFYWPETHTQVLRRIFEMSEQGTRVTYIPGNHDDELRALSGLRLDNIEVVRQAVHVTRSGQRLLVLHGDEFDGLINSSRLAACAGVIAYGLLLSLNRLVHWVHALRGRPYWSLAQNVKLRVGSAVRYTNDFRRACLSAAREARADGVVCGHIHLAEVRRHDDLLYCNDGDWVESCTALVEDQHGELSIVSWQGRTPRQQQLERAVQEAA